MTITLKTADKNDIQVREGKSCNITATFSNPTDGTAIEQSMFYSMTLTLYDKETGATINGRYQQDVIAEIDADGVLNLELDAADNPIVGDVSVGNAEIHVVRLDWQWIDESSDTRDGGEDLEFPVLSVAEITTTTTASP